MQPPAAPAADGVTLDLQRLGQPSLATPPRGADQRLVDQVALRMAAAEALRLVARGAQQVNAARVVAGDEGQDRLRDRRPDLAREVAVVVVAPDRLLLRGEQLARRSSRPALAKAIAAWASLKA